MMDSNFNKKEMAKTTMNNRKKTQLPSLPESIENAFNIAIPEVPKPDKLCFFGIGESSIIGDVIASFINEKTDRFIPSYSNGLVPKWIDQDTTAIITSYSGTNSNIDEIYDELRARKCTIYCLTNGNTLIKKCQSDGVLVFKLPDSLTSRTALGFELGLLSQLIQKMNICKMKDEMSSFLVNVKHYRDSLINNDKIPELIKKIKDQNLSIYGTPDFKASFKRWKMLFNEDLDIITFYGELPEFNHNEIVGWSNHYQNDSNLCAIVLRGNIDDKVLNVIVDKIIEVLRENNRSVIDIQIPGSSSIERNVCAILLGDYLSQMMREDKGDGLK